MPLAGQIVLAIGIIAALILLFLSEDPLWQYSQADRREIKQMLRVKDYAALGRWIKARRGVPADKYNDEAIGTRFAAIELRDWDAGEKLCHDLDRVNLKLRGRPLF